MSKNMEYLWKAHQKALGLTDSEIELMKKNPKSVKIISNSPGLANARAVFRPRKSTLSV